MVAVMFAPAVVPPVIAVAGTVLGVFGLGLFIAMQVDAKELRRLVWVAVAIVLLVGLARLRADELIINDPTVGLCRALDPDENWILWWIYDCTDVLKNAGK